MAQPHENTEMVTETLIEPVTRQSLVATLGRLRTLIPGWVCDQTHPLEIPRTVRVLGVLRVLSGIDQNAREGLAEFEQLMCALDGRPVPRQSLPEVIRARVKGLKRACYTEYFSVFCPPGAGDIILTCKKTHLITRAHSILGIVLEPASPASRFSLNDDTQ